MANNRELLKEALADAKSLREMAITNAKAALEESFTPQIKSMLSNKLQEMELEEDDFYEGEDTERVDEELNLEEILAELEESDNSDPTPVTEVEDDEKETEENEESEEVEEKDEPMDLEDMSEDDLKSFIEGVIADMIEAGDLEAGEDMEGDGMPEDEEVETEEEEVNIDELLAEIESVDEEYKYEDDKESKMEEMSKTYDEYDSKMEEAEVTEDELDEILGFGKDKMGSALDAFVEKHKAEFTKLKDNPSDRETQKDLLMKLRDFKPELRKLAGGDAGGAYKKISDMVTNIQSNDNRSMLQKIGAGTAGSISTKRSNESLQPELNEAYRAIKTLKSELNEVNLLNAKLLYTNRIFKSKNLTEGQKVKVLSTFDKASNVNEVELVYETLNGSFNTKKKSINENLGSASRSVGTTRTTKAPIIEDAAYKRMRELAFYNVKH
jgi:hypothetical protein